MKMNREVMTILAIVMLSCTSALGGIVQMPQTGQTTCYDTTNVEIMCNGATGQDGEIRAGIPWPNPRFENNGDGTVTDNLTGLIWTENANAPGPVSCPTGTPMNWQAALDYLKCLNNNSYLNQNDWRLPNINEISSFMNAGEANLSTWLNSSGFSNVQNGYYWSSTPETFEHGCGMGCCYGYLTPWVFRMQDGGEQMEHCWNSRFAWPVRGGTPCSNATVCLPQTYQLNCYNEYDYYGDCPDFPPPTPIPCTGTGQDGEFRAGVAWPIPRFSANGDSPLRTI